MVVGTNIEVDMIFAVVPADIFLPRFGNALVRMVRLFQLFSGDKLLFEPVNYTQASFDLLDVTIGIKFHWERKENQKFKGSLKFIIEEGKLTAINVLSLEDYLLSVISSEMSATSCLELLKAHAVISRSWLLAQVIKGKQLEQSHHSYQSISETGEEYIRWYDREDHINFDV
ncbi:MAG TPA: SpoIID/LytB domain-containing protein, partial [Bacteroidales bacterium]|nr:SpoIID/LytB domain-containing protein [Bacteroidales bacterium]